MFLLGCLNSVREKSISVIAAIFLRWSWHAAAVIHVLLFREERSSISFPILPILRIITPLPHVSTYLVQAFVCSEC